MKTTLFFQLFLNLCFAALLMVVGILCALFPYAQEPYAHFLTELTAHAWVIPLVGLLLMLLGWMLIRWTFPIMRKGHFKTVVGQTEVWVETGALEKAFANFWKEQFPDNTLSTKIFMRKQTLELIAEVPSPLDKAAVERLKTALRARLQQQLGYLGNFTLSLIEMPLRGSGR